MVVVIAHHGEGVRELPFDVEAVLANTCPAVSGCLALDQALASRPPDEVFLQDGHWAAGGHRIAGEHIAAYLQTVAGFGVGAEQPARPEPVLEDDEVAAVSSGSL